ncbi:hypothetical protein NADFUDRAFT_82489 [Nadsonia fulvescens var. elongata DSM 6958]|uniref:Uncharacterized protein n=1 Tax=Nadsonia fulvescens var. elongata DSM 6958 TaxID=857566 RepID=A0A1E3PMV0_9ASCO|nr:hypothetical protein NADFUDRAFT_82489 [Nadsonia fulvescens var. elongata DSM 6958]
MSESSSRSSTRPNSAGNAAMIITNPDLVKKAKESLKKDKHTHINNSNNRSSRKRESADREKTRRQNNKSDHPKSNSYGGNKPPKSFSNDDDDRRNRKRSDGRLKGSSKTSPIDENSSFNENSSKLSNSKSKGNSPSLVSSSQSSSLKLDMGVDLDLHRELFPAFYDNKASQNSNNPHTSSSNLSKAKQSSSKRNGSSKTMCKEYTGNESRKDNQRLVNQGTRDTAISSTLSSNPQESYVSSSKDLSLKFAGSTFHSSPAPSALPQPSFKPPKIGDTSPGVLIPDLLTGSNNTNNTNITSTSENSQQFNINAVVSSTQPNAFNTLLAADRNERQNTYTSTMPVNGHTQNSNAVGQQFSTNGNVSPPNPAVQQYYIQQQQRQQQQMLQNQHFAPHHPQFPGVIHSQPQPHVHEYPNFQMNGINSFTGHPNNSGPMGVGLSNTTLNGSTTAGSPAHSNFVTAPPRMVNYPLMPGAPISGYNFPQTSNTLQSPMVGNTQFGYSHSPMMAPQSLIHGHNHSQYQSIQPQDHLQQTYGHNQAFSSHAYPPSQDQSMANDLRRALNISGPVAN